MTIHQAAPRLAAYVLAVGLSAAAHTLAFATPYGQIRDREDAEAGRYGVVAAACETGRRLRASANATHSCALAYDLAYRGARYDDALHHAATGCEKNGNATDCRRAIGLPLRMGNDAACEERYALGRRMDLPDVAETLAIDDAETGRPVPAYTALAELDRSLETMARESAAVVAARRAHFIASADLDEMTETLEREAGDRIRAARAAQLCMSTASLPDRETANACWTAYQQAHDTAQYELALRYAAAGCERHGDAASCRSATYLPLHMLEHRITPGPLFASELKRLGKAVCVGGLRVTNAAGRDVTGRICHHYAWVFTPLQASGSAASAEPAERYLTTLRDAASANVLHQAACTRHAQFESCGAHLNYRNTTPARETAGAP